MPSDSRYIEIDVAPLLEALAGPLPLIDNGDRRADIARYLASVQVFLERASQELIANLVAEINAAGGRSELRLEHRGRGFGVVVEPAGAEPEPEPTFNTDADLDFEKVTIRLPGELKDLISQAANLKGLSQNSWYLRELARAISRQGPQPPEPPQPPGGRRGNRMRGYVGD